MDPSEEKKQDSTPPGKKSKIIPTILIVLLLLTIMGIGFYFYSGSKPVPSNSSDSANFATKVKTSSIDGVSGEKEIGLKTADNSKETDNRGGEMRTSLPEESLPNTRATLENNSTKNLYQIANAEDNSPSPEVSPVPVSVATKTTEPQAVKEVSVCNDPELKLDKFYNHLDSQAYMAEYKLSSSSEKHFTALIHKLLDNPPQVTRESDDLYTILKNTAHFFRVSGKDNILMMKGILDNEKSSVEQILADYYLLVTTPKCSTTVYANGIDHDALYEYSCFFLNTMGGRLYLFRRDSLSRMVVTYYAILLVDQANSQNNNRHGIALKPVVDMLIAEMEAGGSSLKQSESYLDKLYDLKEKYQ
jgi:hypothetical protein